MITLTGLITEPPRTAIRDGFLYALLPVAFCGFDQCKHQRNGSYHDHDDLVTTHSASPAFPTSGRLNHRVLFSLLTTVAGCSTIILSPDIFRQGAFPALTIYLACDILFLPNTWFHITFLSALQTSPCRALVFPVHINGIPAQKRPPGFRMSIYPSEGPEALCYTVHQ